jgi:hypothetical protein
MDSKEQVTLHPTARNPSPSGLSWTVMTFEDDTVRILPKNMEKAQSLLTEWYNEIEYFMTIEPLVLTCNTDYQNISCTIDPSVSKYLYSVQRLSQEDLDSITKKEISVSLKDVFIQNYLPCKINQLILNKKVNHFEGLYLPQEVVNSSFELRPIAANPHAKLQPFTSSTISSTSSSSNSTNTSTSSKEAEDLLTHTKIVLETYSTKPSVTVKVPTYFSTESSNNTTLLEKKEEVGGGGGRELLGTYEAFSRWPSGKQGPYGMHSCSFSTGVDGCRWLSASQDNYMLLEEPKQEIHVFFHLKSMKSFVYVPPSLLPTHMTIDATKGTPEKEDPLTLILKTPQCGFVRLFTLKMQPEVVPMVNGLLHNKYHASVEELNSTLDRLHSTLTETERTKKDKQKYTHEEEKIKIYISRSFEIVDDLNYKIKASVLCNDISTNFFYDTATAQGLNVRLSNYLKDMGLQKKRYNDGYYYYGFKPKLRVLGVGLGMGGGGGGGGGGGACVGKIQ